MSNDKSAIVAVKDGKDITAAEFYKEPSVEAVATYAYAVYFPDQPTEELVHDLDELLEDMTNREHTVIELVPASALQAAEDRARKAEEEVKRLTKCLAVANSQAEEFERKWYLECDKNEAAKEQGRREAWKIILECRSSVAFDLRNYEKLTRGYKNSGRPAREIEVVEAEANRLFELMNKIDDGPDRAESPQAGQEVKP